MVILSVVGARPQFVKAAAVSPVLRRSHREWLLHTGQHYDDGLSAAFFRELELPPPDECLRAGSGTHAEQTARMLVGIEAAITRRRPDMVLVYGDTNSTLAGALAAAKLGVPVGHIEAGLRSRNRGMPEEINRIVTDALAEELFCPSESAVQNLEAEGRREGVHFVGDVMADVLHAWLARGESASGQPASPGCDARAPYVLVTIHRAQNTDDPERLGTLLQALGRVTERALFPVHPRTRAALDRLGHRPAAHVELVEPLSYTAMLSAVKQARLVLTDSGGVQKEAYWLGVPCVTLRDETEWPETVAAGWNTLVGADLERIVEAVQTFSPPVERPPLYGDGHAAERIVEVLTRR
jgi:UDP-N-acetylglucosamine 2-epimerase